MSEIKLTKEQIKNSRDIIKSSIHLLETMDEYEKEFPEEFKIIFNQHNVKRLRENIHKSNKFLQDLIDESLVDES
jgi:hypothetical protein